MGVVGCPEATDVGPLVFQGRTLIFGSCRVSPSVAMVGREVDTPDLEREKAEEKSAPEVDDKADDEGKEEKEEKEENAELEEQEEESE